MITGRNLEFRARHKMFFPPQPRFRFYNSAWNYWSILRDYIWRGSSKSAVERAEEKLRRYLNVDHVILTPQGRIAIYLALWATIRPGQRVIMSPYTLYDVVNMVIAAGGEPVFADVDRETCNISACEVERLLDDSTGAVLVTHLHGLVCNLGEIKAACDARGVPLLEDSCQALGARYEDRMAGTIGHMGLFSCGRAKNINAFLGGFIATNDATRASLIRERLATLPFESRARLLKRILHCFLGDVLTSPIVFPLLTYWIFRHGVLHESETVTRQFNTEANPLLRRTIPNSYLRRLSPQQANLITGQVKSIDSKSAKRIRLAQIYYEGLRDIPGIILPPMRFDQSHIYLSYPIQVRDRLKLQRYMFRRGRDVVIQHIGNTADLACFAEWHSDCANARTTASEVLLLPTYPRYSEAQARKNVEVIRTYFRKPNG